MILNRLLVVLQASTEPVVLREDIKSAPPEDMKYSVSAKFIVMTR